MKKQYLYLLILVISCSTAQAKVILWDLGGVLFEPDKLGVALEMGLGGVISHSFWDLRSPMSLQTDVFDLLRQLEKPFEENIGVAGSASGMSLPTIMCRWQAGTITGKEIIKRAKRRIKRLYKFDYFDSTSHMKLVKRCIKTMFNPEILAKNCHPVLEGFKMVRESSRLRNEDGSKKHRQFVFSNWDHLSFDICRKMHRHYFSYFEEIVISGHIKLIKPYKNAYEYLIKTYNLDPKECILIDDQASNVRAAKRCGMQAVRIHDRDYVALQRDLKRLGVLE